MMDLPSTIRLAATNDAEAILAIYAPIVTDSAVSFELEPPDLGEMRRRIEKTLETMPWLVCTVGDEVVGFAYAAKHREREAYQWSVEVSAYVADAWQRRGIARGLYTSLLAILMMQGYRNACAGIALPNAASVAFHESMGFSPVGVYRCIGYKLGRWHDVGWWQRSLIDSPDAPPPPPISIVEAAIAEGFEDALLAGSAQIRP